MLPLVGRAQELELLRARFTEARNGRGQLVLVAGEPGIGKTRLASEFARDAESAGIRVGWGRASEDEGSPPYWLFRQVLRTLGQNMPAVLAGGTLDPSPAARFAAFETLAQQLHAVADVAGLVVVLDDLQWADAASLALLVHLARGLDRSRLMVVATYRDTESTGREALSTTLAALAHEAGLTRIRLVGLTGAEVAKHLALVTGSEVSDELARRVSRRTGGNPFFVTELGRLVDRPDGTLPDAVLDTVRARLHRLADPCRTLLATAAVLGSDLDPAALAQLEGRAVGSVLADLDEAAAAGLVTGGERWRFCHDLVRESARLELPTARRLAAHAELAALLERRTDARERTAEIAHHWLESLPVGDPARAREAAERAADEALAQLAWEDATELYRRARAADADLPPRDQVRLLLREGVAQLRGGELRSATTALAAAADVARDACDPLGLAEIALAIEGMSDPWAALRGSALAAEALAGLPEEDSPLRARLLALQAGEAGFVGGGDAEQVSAAALAMAERLGDVQAMRSALRSRQMVRSGPDGVHERLDLGDRMLALGRSEGDDDTALWGHLWRFDALGMLGRLDDAEAELRPIGALAERLRRPVARWHHLRSTVAIEIARGRFDSAAALAEQAIRLVRGRAHEALEGVSFSALTVVAGLTGRRELVTDDMVELFVRSAPPFVRTMLSLYWLRLGDGSRAVRDLQASGSTDDMPIPAILSIACTRVELAAAFDRPDDATRAAELLRPYGDLFATGGAGAVLVAGSVRTYLGMAAATSGRLDEAVRQLRLGIEANTRAGTPPFSAQAQYELAKVLARRRRLGDSDEAQALAAAASATAKQLGMAPLHREASSLAGSLRGDSPGPLTRREREVAQHVATGLTNRQVAALLHISERTAESHVQHVLTKLGLDNRTQLAAWAQQELRTGDQ